MPPERVIPEKLASVVETFPPERRIDALISGEQNPRLRDLWTHFDAISLIPRASGQEEGVRGYLREYVTERAERGFEYHRDEVGNVAILIPGTEGFEDVPGVILQGHMDMVVLPSGEEGPAILGVKQVVSSDGNYLQSATGSTSGADNAIGLAAALSLADSEAHGPLMIVATVDEEIGLGGAENIHFPEIDLSQYKEMINLDSEKEGEITIGCAGAAGTNITLPLEREPISDGKILVEINIDGLLGGHSGLMIGKNRHNGVRFLNMLLRQLDRGFKGGFNLVDINGGQAENAIPKSAQARIAVDSARLLRFTAVMSEVSDSILGITRTEEQPQVAYEVVNMRGVSMLTSRSSQQVLDLLNELPHGVDTWTDYKPGLPETSTNMGLVESTDGELRVRMLSRSFIDSERHRLERRIAEVAEAHGARVEQERGYRAWEPDPNNDLVALAQEVHEELTGRQAEEVAEHFGIECGVILARPQFRHLRAISIGPNIRNAHETREDVEIESVRRFYQYLEALTTRIAQAA